MANLKEIRSRITSVGSTMQITSAMKMVSAAKLKRAQDAITQMRPYANKLTELLENLSTSLEASGGGVYTQNREIKKVLLELSKNEDLILPDKLDGITAEIPPSKFNSDISNPENESNAFDKRIKPNNAPIPPHSLPRSWTISCSPKKMEINKKYPNDNNKI